jgi:hypothetical protein
MISLFVDGYYNLYTCIQTILGVEQQEDTWRKQPVNGGDEVEELPERVHVFVPAPYREHVVCELVYVVPNLSYGLVRVQVPLRHPTVTDDHSAGFDPVTNNSHQRSARIDI